MKQIEFKVIVPAMNNTGNMIVADPARVYLGTALPNGMAPAKVGPALVLGGTQVDGKWMGCTYTHPSFPIPGFGEMSVR